MRFGRIAKVGAGEYRKIGPGSRSGLPAKPDTQGLEQL
jgi:hypothetical protein